MTDPSPPRAHSPRPHPPEDGCPFCAPDASRIFHAGPLTLGLWDGYPVNPGHALLIPKRHVATWFDATPEEQAELTQAITTAREHIERTHAPAGYNVGFNLGATAGQTVHHLHLHVIPRYEGDTPDPTGGVRNVIPERGNYLNPPPQPGDPVADRAHPTALDRPAPAAAPAPSSTPSPQPHAHPHPADAPPLLGDPPHRDPLVFGADDDPLLPHLLAHLDHTHALDIAVAFVYPHGVHLIHDRLIDLLRRGGRLRLLTGDYLTATDPDALAQLLDLTQEARDADGNPEPERVQLRVYQARDRSFHPKTFIFRNSPDPGRPPQAGLAFVGSSNLTRTALKTGVEWNYRIVSELDPHGFAHVEARFEALFQDPATVELTHEWITEYRARHLAARPPAGSAAAKKPTTPDSSAAPEEAALADEKATQHERLEPAAPRPIQREALRALDETRSEGNRAGLVVLATGLGKTWLAAFDALGMTARPPADATTPQTPDPPATASATAASTTRDPDTPYVPAPPRTPGGRILFVAHREEILNQALRVFRRVDPTRALGRYDGQEKTPDADVVFASIQTLGRRPSETARTPSHLEQFAPDAFAYIVMDEFHHADAATYRRVLDHFDPEFLLGLTATPERTDGGDLLALCGENLVFRTDLFEGIQRQELAPFHYYGVPDELDYDQIPWRSGRFDPNAFSAAAATEARAENAYEQLQARGGTRTLAFCASVAHARYMNDYFTDKGLRTAAVHSHSDSAPRAEAIDQLTEGELDVVITVDMFNEGVDVPRVDTVLMLRPTESKLLWLQQIGRGLRLAEDKDHLAVIDYVGNHRAFLTQLQALFDLPGDPVALGKQIIRIRENGGELTLPGGCHVTYDLEAIEVLEKLSPRTQGIARVEAWIQSFTERHERRPTAVEAYHDGINPKKLPRSLGTWHQAIAKLEPELLSDADRAVFDHSICQAFLAELHGTKMTRSYKMLTLLAATRDDAFFTGVPIPELTRRFQKHARRSAQTVLDVTGDLDDLDALERRIREQPIPAWLRQSAPDGTPYFALDGASAGTTASFRFQLVIPEPLQETFRHWIQELVEWRLADYLERKRKERRTPIYADDGRKVDAHFTMELTRNEPAIRFHSRGGKAGTKGALNREYAEGLRIVLDRLKRAKVTVPKIELDTSRTSGQALEVNGYEFPLAMAEVEDVENLRLAIGRAQGDNGTRTIRIETKGWRGGSLMEFQRWLSRSTE